MTHRCVDDCTSLDSSSPLTLVSPVRCTHLALGNILSVTSLKGLCPGSHGLISSLPLLTKPDGLNLVTTLATATWLFVAWLGVRLGLLNPDTPALFNRESGFVAISIYPLRCSRFRYGYLYVVLNSNVSAGDSRGNREFLGCKTVPFAYLIQ